MNTEHLPEIAAPCCVYTSLIGDYEQLNEQPVAMQSRLPFICLTDSPGLRSETWHCRVVTPLFPRDPIRSQRAFKIRAHAALPGFARSIYIDNSVILRQPPERLLELLGPSEAFLLARHGLRETVLDEFLEVSRLGYDDNTRIFEQLNHYALSCPEVLQERPWWAGIMVRDHRSARVRTMLEYWASHVMRYSRRDQLSINAAFRAAELHPTALPIDLTLSDLHSWPHARGRDRARGGRDPAASLMPLSARARQLEQHLTERDATIAALREQADTQQQAAQADTAALRAEVDRLSVDVQAERAARETDAESHRTEIARVSEMAMRDRADGVRLAAGLAALAIRHDAMLGSASWRVTAPLRALGRRCPPMLRKAARRMLRLLWWSITLRLPSRLRAWRAARTAPPQLPHIPTPRALRDAARRPLPAASDEAPSRRPISLSAEPW